MHALTILDSKTLYLSFTHVIPMLNLFTPENVVFCVRRFLSSVDKQCEIKNIWVAILIHFIPLVSFYTPWKHQKTIDFLMFSWGKEKDQWHKMRQSVKTKCKQEIMLKWILKRTSVALLKNHQKLLHISRDNSFA